MSIHYGWQREEFVSSFLALSNRPECGDRLERRHFFTLKARILTRCLQHNVAQMIEAAKTDAPKTYAAVAQLVRNYRTKYVEKLDEPAKTFANQVVLLLIKI